MKHREAKSPVFPFIDNSYYEAKSGLDGLDGIGNLPGGFSMEHLSNDNNLFYFGIGSVTSLAFHVNLLAIGTQVKTKFGTNHYWY